MDEKTYKVVLFGYSPGAERIRARMLKYFRRRAAAISPCGDGSLDVTLRNGSRIRYSEIRAAQFRREPFVELSVTSTQSYVQKSIAAVQDYARKCDYGLFVEAREEPKRTSG